MIATISVVIIIVIDSYYYYCRPRVFRVMRGKKVLISAEPCRAAELPGHQRSDPGLFVPCCVGWRYGSAKQFVP